MAGSAGEVVRRFWTSVWTEGNSAELFEIFDPALRENGEAVDTAQFAEIVDKWRKVFPDFSAIVEELFEVGEGRVVSRVTYRGTQALPWASIPPTGKAFECVGIDIFTVRDGRIVELWHAIDHYDMAVQLGGRIAPVGTDS
jgi:predicted ester cyclase